MHIYVYIHIYTYPHTISQAAPCGGIQAVFRLLDAEAALSLYTKPKNAWKEGPDGRMVGHANEQIWSMPEYMMADALDAGFDFFASDLWHFPPGPQQDRVLTATAREWKLHSKFPSLDVAGDHFQPLADPDFGFYRFYRNLIKAHEGEVRLATNGSWKEFHTPAPLELAFWHCQYMQGRQRQVAESLGCRGALRGSARGDGTIACQWRDRPKLRIDDMKKLSRMGDTTMCQTEWYPGDPTKRNSHRRHQGTILTYPRLLVFLVKCGGHIDLHAAETWWRSLPVICYQKCRSKPNEDPKGPKGRSKGSKGHGRGSKGS
jgi:hypothetical protein